MEGRGKGPRGFTGRSEIFCQIIPVIGSGEQYMATVHQRTNPLSLSWVRVRLTVSMVRPRVSPISARFMGRVTGLPSWPRASARPDPRHLFPRQHRTEGRIANLALTARPPIAAEDSVAVTVSSKMPHPIPKPGTITPLMCSQFGHLATSGLARIGWILPDSPESRPETHLDHGLSDRHRA